MFTDTLGYGVFVYGPACVVLAEAPVATSQGDAVGIVDVRHADTDDVVASQKDRNLDDADDQLTYSSTPARFSNAMLERDPDRHLGATTLWAGTNARDARTGDAAKNSVMEWFHPLLARGMKPNAE